MKFSGVTILQGDQISDFSIDFCMGLTTVQCWYIVIVLWFDAGEYC